MVKTKVSFFIVLASLFLVMGVEQVYADSISYKDINFETLLKFAEEGDPEAQMRLGVRHLQGKNPEAYRNESKAIEWLEKAAAQDNAVANNLLAGFYYGRPNPDIKKILRYHEKAAALGHTASMTDLGQMYRDGYYVEKDHKKAMNWFKKAEGLGDKSATFLIEDMAQQVELDELNEALDQEPPDNFRHFENPELEMREVIAEDVAALFLDKNFDELERLSKDYLNTQSRSPSGKWKYALFFNGLEKMSQRGLKATPWEQIFSTNGEWIEKKPESSVAKISKGAALNNRAWAVMGGNNFSRPHLDLIPPERKAEFLKCIQIAYDYMMSIKESSSDNPEWYVIMLEIMRGFYEDYDAYMSVVNEGLDKFPTFYPIYFTSVMYISPNWLGDNERIEAFARDAVKRTKDKEGYSLYVRIYWQGSQVIYGPDIFEKSYAVWNDMKKGIKDVLKDYSEQWNLHNFAFFSCLAQDREMTKELMEQIEIPKILNPTFMEFLNRVWKEPKFFEVCKGWSESDRGFEEYIVLKEQEEKARKEERASHKIEITNPADRMVFKELHELSMYVHEDQNDCKRAGFPASECVCDLAADYKDMKELFGELMEDHPEWEGQILRYVDDGKAISSSVDFFQTLISNFDKENCGE